MVKFVIFLPEVSCLADCLLRISPEFSGLGFPGSCGSSIFDFFFILGLLKIKKNKYNLKFHAKIN